MVIQLNNVRTQTGQTAKGLQTEDIYQTPVQTELRNTGMFPQIRITGTHFQISETILITHTQEEIQAAEA